MNFCHLSYCSDTKPNTKKNTQWKNQHDKTQKNHKMNQKSSKKFVLIEKCLFGLNRDDAFDGSYFFCYVYLRR